METVAEAGRGGKGEESAPGGAVIHPRPPKGRRGAADDLDALDVVGGQRSEVEGAAGFVDGDAVDEHCTQSDSLPPILEHLASLYPEGRGAREGGPG